MDDDAQPRRLWWLILLLTVPLLVAAGVGAWMVLSPTEAEPTNQGPRVPELSGRGRPLNTPQPVNDNTEPTPDNSEPEPKPDQPEESQPVETSEEDIPRTNGRKPHSHKQRPLRIHGVCTTAASVVLVRAETAITVRPPAAHGP
jgi:hypothetical protein